jgi:hypothetical protein
VQLASRPRSACTFEPRSALEQASEESVGCTIRTYYRHDVGTYQVVDNADFCFCFSSSSVKTSLFESRLIITTITSFGWI